MLQIDWNIPRISNQPINLTLKKWQPIIHSRSEWIWQVSINTTVCLRASAKLGKRITALLDAGLIMQR